MSQLGTLEVGEHTLDVISIEAVEGALRYFARTPGRRDINPGRVDQWRWVGSDGQLIAEFTGDLAWETVRDGTFGVYGDLTVLSRPIDAGVYR